MKQIQLVRLCFALMLFSLLFSCKQTTPDTKLLSQAQSLVEVDPTRASVLLDSIAHPESMDKGSHMQYVVAQVQAKFKLGKDISGDTIIVEAQKYFNNKGDADKAALANLYAGIAYYQNDESENAMLSFLQAEHHAKLAKNNLITGRSLNNIATLYFDKSLMDTAIVRYKEALTYYNNTEGADLSRLNAISSIGAVYEIENNTDSAHTYFYKGLNLAKQAENIPYQAAFAHQLGVNFRKKKEYAKSTEYLHTALAQTTRPLDSLRTYLAFSKLYNDKHQQDSAKYYTDIIKGRLASTTDNYVLRSIYGSLADHNRQIGNYKEAFEYINLQKEINQKIQQADSKQKLFEAQSKYIVSLKEEELSKMQLRSFFYLIIGLLIASLGVLLNHYRNKQAYLINQQEQAKNKLLESQNKMLSLNNNLLNQKVDSMKFLHLIYKTILQHWSKIDREILQSQMENPKEKEPEMFVKIREMIGEMKDNTNIQFVERGKELLQSQPMGEKALKELTQEDLLLIVLCHCRYSLREIAYILGIAFVRANIEMRIMGIRNKLQQLGLSQAFIYQTLFSGD